MKSFKQHTGKVIPIDSSNIDTDQILPKQFLKRIERTGYDKYLFYHWRYKEDGTLNEDSIFNKKIYKDGSILLTRSNFGTGSSREHAVWALENYGIRVIISSSYGDIFYNNCFNNGVLPIRLSNEQIDQLFENVMKIEGYKLTVDLEKNQILDDKDINYHFEVDPTQKKKLLQGLDNISESIKNAKQIDKYESNIPNWYLISK